ncbi:5-formyltetrahydrofolate cyclo-ligase [Criibacterium bergeronii]|uniref:5-formyltetrahydrofolate cyclo-ligase n=1 Tax=Criibacterium bergeronii TaxID=1871336 RepID=A0A1C0ADW6_9FIRM|nr:5-formyltetrahydrofolate cyclo-ligase [Criibacterium bergeronii]MBS6062707.1 5-formyltetrahydrofolate cyclo-ligase [Peptostreptococcaceae bacterium]RDY21468.1 5-formyltetrahydrofolate cyclo-ligase [Criibacterium bergeronii]TRW28009.1 5-formyltetrahydrofolate cyclo-ligase [Criibacterium bergeronii]
MTKKELRKQMLSIRDNLTQEEIDKKSEIIIKKLENEEVFKKADTIMLFASFGSEVNTHNLIKKCIDMGLVVCLPYVENAKESIMKATAIKSFDNLEHGYKGILEVKKELIEEIDPAKIDLIVTPCVCFDLQKYRVGYGKGFYDRFFGKTKAYKIGICFDECIVEKIDTNEYDLPVDIVITDKRKLV